MKQKWLGAVFALYFFLSPANLRADIWGGDVAVLSSILINAIQQLAQLRQIVGSGRDSLELMGEINRGINDSMNVIRTINPNTDPGLFREWQRISDGLAHLQAVYGIIVPSQDMRIQQETDQSVAEAVTFNNSIYQYTRDIDAIGETIKSYSHSVSPGGAQKLTAQSLGIILHVLNTSLRTQATGLKLQAQTLAIENHKDKEATRHMIETSDDLGLAMRSQDPTFTLPRF